MFFLFTFLNFPQCSVTGRWKKYNPIYSIKGEQCQYDESSLGPYHRREIIHIILLPRKIIKLVAWFILHRGAARELSNFDIFRQYAIFTQTHVLIFAIVSRTCLILALLYIEFLWLWRSYKMMNDDEWSWSAYKMFIFSSVKLFQNQCCSYKG